jgi:hypothetical protein
MADHPLGSDQGTEPLSANIQDQLREKERLDDEAEQERRAAEEREQSLERHKQAERDTAAAHGGDRETFRQARVRARSRSVQRQPTLGSLLLIALGVAALVRVFRRR